MFVSIFKKRKNNNEMYFNSNLASYLMVIPPHQKITNKDRLMLNLPIGKIYTLFFFFLLYINANIHIYRQRIWSYFDCRG